MARLKEFDPERAVDKALALFRLRGYVATSVDDLVQYLGIGRGSLYDTFGSKHALYLAALDRYLAQSQQGELPAGDNVKAIIAAVLTEQVDIAIAAAPLGGCFLVNSVAELAGHDDDVAQRAKENLADAEKMFFAILARDPALGHTSDECRRLAQFFVNVILGIRLQAKANPNRAVLDNVVAAALTVLV